MLSGPTATLAGTAASIADAIAGTDTSKYLTPAAGAARALYGDSTRRVAGYVQCDGATSNRAAGIYGPFDASINRRGWIAGAAAVTWLFPRVPVPTSNPADAYFLWFAGGTATPNSDTTANPNAIHIALGVSGSLFIRRAGATSSDVRTHAWAGFRAAYSGQEPSIEIRVTSANSLLVKVDGVDVSSNFVETTGGSEPGYLDSTLNPVWHINANRWPSGIPALCIPILGTLTDAEAEAWRTTGRLPAWVARGGAVRRFVSDFSSSTGWVLGGTSTISGGKLNLGEGINGQTAMSVASNFTVFNTGDKCSFTVTVDSITAGSVSYWNGLAYVPFATAPGTYTVEFTWVASYVAGPILRAVGGTAVLDDYAGTVLGALTVPVVQPCLVLGDGTHIGDNQGRLLGCLPVTDEQRGRLVIRTHTSSAQDVQAFGGPVFLEANRSRMDSICGVQNSGGALNIQIGSTSGGSDIAASTSIASGSVPTEITPALRFPPTQNLWVRRVAGAGTGPFTTTIDFHRIGPNP